MAKHEMLKKCPFCGGEAEVVEYFFGCTIHCTKCSANVQCNNDPENMGRKKAVAMWNNWSSMNAKANGETKTEYAVQFRFKARGQWHIDGRPCSSFEEAHRLMALRLDQVNHEQYRGIARYWRVVARKVTKWEEVTGKKLVREIM